MIASNLGNLVTQIAGTWTLIMGALIIVLWIGLAERKIRAFFNELLGRTGAGINTNADLDAFKMRAKGRGPFIGN